MRSVLVGAVFVLLLAVACGPNWIVPESGVVGSDATSNSNPSVDSGTPSSVSACCVLTHTSDVGVVVEDSDAGCPIDDEVDAGEVFDAGTPVPDAGTVVEDAGSSCEHEEPRKVALCHVPRGKPSNAHTIRIGEPAVAAHLRHGDYLGECQNGN